MLTWPPSPDALATRLGQPTPAAEELADALKAAVASVRLVLGYDPRPAAGRTAYVAGTGTHRLRLPARTVSAVTAVYEDAGRAFGPETLLVEGEDYAVDLPAGVLTRLGTVWAYRLEREVGRLAPTPARDPGTVKVVYTAGCDDDPAAVAADAALAEAAARWQARATGAGGPVASEGFIGASYSLAGPAGAKANGRAWGLLSDYAAELLLPIRDVPVA